MRVLCEIDVMVQRQNGDVVGKSTSVVLRMHEDTHDVAFDVGVELDVVIYIPFA